MMFKLNKDTFLNLDSILLVHYDEDVKKIEIAGKDMTKGYWMDNVSPNQWRNISKRLDSLQEKGKEELIP